MADRNDGKVAVAPCDDLHQPFQTDQSFTVQIVGFIHEQGDRLAGTDDKLLQLAFSLLTLGRDFRLFLPRQIVEEG